MKHLSDEELGQMWANKFSWYLMEMEQGRVLLDDETHARLVAEMRQLDVELRSRGRVADGRYADAFERRELLPAEDMRRLAIQTYGRPVTFKGLQQQAEGN